MSRLSSLADAVHANLDDPTVAKVLYETNRSTNRQRRRIHWYSEPSQVVPPRQAGGRTEQNNRSPAVWERQERVACLVFAESVDTLDTLLDNLIVAADHTVPNGSGMLEATYDFDWVGVGKRIPSVRLEFMVKWPVLDEIKALTEITDVENTCEFMDDE